MCRPCCRGGCNPARDVLRSLRSRVCVLCTFELSLLVRPPLLSGFNTVHADQTKSRSPHLQAKFFFSGALGHLMSPSGFWWPHDSEKRTKQIRIVSWLSLERPTVPTGGCVPRPLLFPLRLYPVPASVKPSLRPKTKKEPRGLPDGPSPVPPCGGGGKRGGGLKNSRNRPTRQSKTRLCWVHFATLRPHTPIPTHPDTQNLVLDLSEFHPVIPCLHPQKTSRQEWWPTFSSAVK